jgi:hypothetical protein
MLEIAKANFLEAPLERRRLMNLTESEAKKRGLWEREDNHLSESSGPKSKGLANIDYRFSDMARNGELINIRRGVWKLRKM